MSDGFWIKMTVPFDRLLVHWRSLVIVLVPLALSPLIALGNKVGIQNVFVMFVRRKKVEGRWAQMLFCLAKHLNIA